MDKIRFGKTELLVSRIAFGGIPIQRVGVSEAVGIVRRAIGLGINFIDTANNYADSEDKIGIAIKGVPRDSLVLSSKSHAKDKKTFLEHIDLSLKKLGTDYIDLYHHHMIQTPENYDMIMGEGGAWEGMMEAVKAGKVRFPAFSSHSIPMALKIMRDGKFDAVQLAFNFFNDEAAAEAIPLAKELDMGFISMKPFGGGLLSDAGLALRYLMQFNDIVPDPGIETQEEIEEIVRIVDSGEKFSAEDAAAIEKIRTESNSVWCHRCGYCNPCPQGIVISGALTIDTFVRRFSLPSVMSMASKNMEQARGCTECRECVKKCPYDLDVPALLKEKLIIWDKYLEDNNYGYGA